MMLVSVLVCVGAMRVFTELYVLSGGSGGPGGQAMSMVMLIQSMGKGLNGQVGYASAISLVLFLLTLVPLAIVGVANNSDTIKEALADGARPRTRSSPDSRRQEEARR